MTSSSDEIQELFGLNKEEKLIDNFECFLVENIPILGKLYLTENFICFYSNLIFFNRNITIPINEVSKISLKMPNLEISLKNKINSNNKYSFTSKDNIQVIHDKIKSVYDSHKSDNSDNTNQNPDLGNSGNNTASTKPRSNEDSLNNINDLIEEIKFSPIEPDVDFEICRKIININPKDLFNKYHTKSSPETNYEKFCEWLGDHSNINISDWRKLENPDNSEFEKFERTESFSLSLSGVPFVDHSDVTKTLTYYIDKNGTYHINGISKSVGIPFADSFTISTKIEFHPCMNNTKTVFRTYVRTNFLKTIFVKPILISQTKKSYTEEVEKWLEFIEEKGDKILGDYISKEKEEESLKDKEKKNIKNGKLNSKMFISLGLLFLGISIILYILSHKNKKSS